MLNKNDLVIKILSCRVFNKADCLQSLPVGGCSTVIRLCCCTVSLLGLRIDVCIYICINRQSCRVTVWLCDFGEKLLGHDNPTFVLPFGTIFWSEMTFS